MSYTRFVQTAEPSSLGYRLNIINLIRWKKGLLIRLWLHRLGSNRKQELPLPAKPLIKRVTTTQTVFSCCHLVTRHHPMQPANLMAASSVYAIALVCMTMDGLQPLFFWIYWSCIASPTAKLSHTQTYACSGDFVVKKSSDHNHLCAQSLAGSVNSIVNKSSLHAKHFHHDPSFAIRWW